MKQVFKCFSLLGVLLIGFSVFVSAGTSVHAAETLNKKLVADVVETGIVSEISLDGFTSKEETIIVDNEGNYVGKLSVEEEVGISTRQAGDKYKLANKTYNVSFIGITCNFGYKVTVKNKNITKAYGTWSNGLLWSTTLGKPYYTSTTSGVKGQTSVAIDLFSMNTTVRLYGNISGNYLVTGMKLS
ncbi:DUF5626 family protein [Enterococcus sp. 5B3_DIV0040]|uniref:DUF5626 family protein n=1 Tax=Enterococcus sp. 5B3_DIV0040 TaxID=1834182 RepID=UPI000B688695|nr:DUF5626 family protein [Enterococcus sp. 5B3_DIV0040]OTO05311.1 hypothetical protein A5883_002303 [Enterococcus sp. 5B3_DIV0040]